MNLIKPLTLVLTILVYGTLAACDQHTENEHDDHNEESLSIPATSAIDEHGDEWVITLTAIEVQNAGIKTGTAQFSSVPQTRRLYGETRLNEERVIHKYPKYAGVVRDVRVNIGDRVQSGDTLAIVFNTSTLGLYSVISPQPGEVLEKHAVVGEFMDGSEPIMVVGDLNSVWVDLHAFEKDMPLIRKGQTLTLHPVEGPESMTTSIRYIKPVMEPETRTNIVRCVLNNRDGKWNPGRLVYAEVISNTSKKEVLVVPESSVQMVDSQQVVFVPESDQEFEVVPVQTGIRGSGVVEIIGGIGVGEKVVTDGAFLLKSELVTSTLSGHAGHGH